jgi:HD-GYP domain-containing protein (c-di-GMP phosphodiesterase class II)
MNKTIKITELKVGMYVNLSGSWRAHPFLRNNFTVTSSKQIQKMMEYGIKEVNIDEQKGIPSESVIQEVVQPEKDFFADIKIVPEKLEDVLYDAKMPPAERAEAIHLYSVEMMRNLWQNPTGENIAKFKQGIFSVVDLVLANDDINNRLLNLISHDYNTYIHSVNVGVLAISLAKILFIKESKHDMHALGAGFFLHDIGKIYIDEAIISKPGKLTAEEMNIIRKHPGMGFKHLVETKQITDESRLIILQHHERHNGTGYPRRLHGEDIHIYGRICSVADVFDALVSKRPYKEQLKPFEALKIMKDEMLDHFHKDVFEKFVLLFLNKPSPLR